MDRDDRLIWSVREYISSLGKPLETLKDLLRQLPGKHIDLEIFKTVCMFHYFLIVMQITHYSTLIGNDLPPVFLIILLDTASRIPE